jgi:Ser/Thr protein kinase RdoA (MazF antagonist)
MNETPDLAALTRLGQGRVAEVFALDEDRVVKVARDGAGESLDREALAMTAAHAAGMPVPSAHGLVEISGRRALIMGRARGTDMLTQFARRPWTLLRAGSKLGRLHAQLHGTVAPSELPSLKGEFDQRIRRSPHIPDPLRERVLAVLRDLPDGDRICHLDFHPANVMTDGASLTVIDWPGACRGDPLADVALTTLILRGGKTAPGTPFVTRLLAPIGRKILLGGYQRGYRKHATVDRDRFARWYVVAAAIRLSYDITGEAESLREVIARGP